MFGKWMDVVMTPNIYKVAKKLGKTLNYSLFTTHHT